MSQSEVFQLADGTEATVWWVNGPPYLSVTYKKPKEKKNAKEFENKSIASPRRTKSQVRAERASGTGCCDRYIDNMACNCLNVAIEDDPKYIHPYTRIRIEPKGPLTEEEALRKQAILQGYEGVPCPWCASLKVVRSNRDWACEGCGRQWTHDVKTKTKPVEKLLHDFSHSQTCNYCGAVEGLAAGNGECPARTGLRKTEVKEMEPCCDCGEDYLKDDLMLRNEILCPKCREKPNRLDRPYKPQNKLLHEFDSEITESICKQCGVVGDTSNYMEECPTRRHYQNQRDKLALREKNAGRPLPHCGVPSHDLECAECSVRLYGKNPDEVCRYNKPQGK